MLARSDKTVIDAVQKPASPEAQLEAIKNFVGDGSVHRVVIDRKLAYFLVERDAGENDEALTIEAALYDTIRQGVMEEHTPADDRKGIHVQLFDIFRTIAEEGLEVSHILAGDRVSIEKAMLTRFQRLQTPKIFGIQVYFSAQVPADSYIVCGALTKDAFPGEVRFSIKGSIG